MGALATCNPMGAGKWRAEYSEALKARVVVILPDNDNPGHVHAAKVATDLLRVGCEVRIVEIPKGKDASDWLAAGGTLADIQALASSQPALTHDALAALLAHWGLDTTAPGAKPEHLAKSSPFRVTDDSVLYIDPDPDKEPLMICSRLDIAAVTRDSHGDGWGRLSAGMTPRVGPMNGPCPCHCLRAKVASIGRTC